MSKYKFLEKMPNIKFIRASLTDVFENGRLDNQKKLFLYKLDYSFLKGRRFNILKSLNFKVKTTKSHWFILKQVLTPQIIQQKM